jgi:predicted outer membrane protein
MECNKFFVMAALSAFVVAGSAWAESEAEYAQPAPVSAPRIAGERPAQQLRTVAKPVARPALFAPAAAANAKRLSAQQREERHFLKDAAASSRFEAEASRMALGKSSDPGVRSMAATLINHHASVTNELLHMLHGRGMAAPMLANDQRKILNRLAKLHGGKFDREYLAEVAMKYQQEDVQLYEKASLVATEPRLKAWIDRMLPTLRYQLETAERLAPVDVRLARSGATVHPAAANRFVSRAGMATRSMGSGPAPASAPQFGGMQFGGDAQLGVPRPVATRPIESSTR